MWFLYVVVCVFVCDWLYVFVMCIVWCVFVGDDCVVCLVFFLKFVYDVEKFFGVCVVFVMVDYLVEFEVVCCVC